MVLAYSNVSVSLGAPLAAARESLAGTRTERGPCAPVLAIVGQLVAKAEIDNRVGKDHRRAAAGHHCPHATALVEHGELERRARLRVELANVVLFGQRDFAKRRRVRERAPLVAALKVRRLVDLGGHVEHGHALVVGAHHKRIDFEVAKVVVGVEREQQAQKAADHRALARVADVAQQLAQLRVAQRRAGADQRTARVRIDVAHVDAAARAEEHELAIAHCARPSATDRSPRDAR